MLFIRSICIYDLHFKMFPKCRIRNQSFTNTTRNQSFTNTLSSFFSSEELEHLEKKITFHLMIAFENRTRQRIALSFMLTTYFQWYANTIAQLPSQSCTTLERQTEEQRCPREMHCQQFASSQHGSSSPLQTKLYTKARVSAGL